jgi:dihydroorotate dehydrogenase
LTDWYRLAWPLLRRLDPERAHALAINLLARGLVPASPPIDDPALSTEAFGRRLFSPIGLAAGFDKDG